MAMTNRFALAAAAATFAGALLTLPAHAREHAHHHDGAGDEPLTLAVYGDWPYSQALLDAAPQLIASVNGDPDVSLVLHVGDIHSGSMACSAAWNQGIFDLFQQFADPFVYTPGDNEWTDCHKAKEFSSGYPLTELARVRQLFFPTPGLTLGQAPRRLLSQAQLPSYFHPTDAQLVEN